MGSIPIIRSRETAPLSQQNRSLFSASVFFSPFCLSLFLSLAHLNSFVTLRQISFALLFRRFAPCDSHHSLHFDCACVSTKPKPFSASVFFSPFCLSLFLSLALSNSFVTLRQISFALLFRRFAPCDSHHSLHFDCACVSTKPKPFSASVFFSPFACLSFPLLLHLTLL